MIQRPTTTTDRPLRGVRVLVTRAEEDAETLRALLESLGARVTCAPTIAIRPTTDLVDAIQALDHLREYDWVAFTSRNAVRAVFTCLQGSGRAPLEGVKVAAVGPATAAELASRGITPDCVPAEAGGHALGAAMAERGVAGNSVLLPVGNLARDDVLHTLESAGARVTVVQVYETIIPETASENAAHEVLLQNKVDVVTFASPSAFHNLLRSNGPDVALALRRAHLVAIGPTTADAITASGFTPSATADPHTSGGLAAAIIGLCKEQAL